MSNTIKIRRSATPSAVPTTAQLQLGELAINTYDGKLFLKKSVSGVETVVEIGGGAGGVTSFNTRTGAVTLSSSDVTTALGYTPYNSSNPSGYITSSALSGYLTSSTASSTYLALSGGTLTGNLAFNGTGLRITGDMSNATLSSRLWIQTSTTNGATSVFAVPNGTSDTAGWTAFGGSDPANATIAQLLATSTEISVRAGKNGTASYTSLAFYTNGTKQLTLDTAGGLTLGSNPSGRTVAFAIGGNNNGGGTGYHEFFALTNTYASATTPNKFIRMNSSGALEIVNSGYTNVIFQLTDAGALAVPSLASSVTGTTQAAETANTTLATTAFVDRLRSLGVSATTGTAVINDRGDLIPLTAGMTIPASVFAAGDTFTLYNNSAGNLTITQGAGLTLRQVGTANTGNRTLAQRGLVTVVFISATEAVISGGGLT